MLLWCCGRVPRWHRFQNRHRSLKSYHLQDVILSFRLQGGRARTYLCTCRADSHDYPAGSPRGRSYCMVAQDISYSDRCHSHVYSSWVIKILPDVRKSKSLKWCPRAQTKGQWRHHLRRMTGHLHSELLVRYNYLSGRFRTAQAFVHFWNVAIPRGTGEGFIRKMVLQYKGWTCNSSAQSGWGMCHWSMLRD